MTVEELITKLQEFPPDMRVLINGYEGGLQDPNEPVISPVHIYEEGHGGDYCGDHEECSMEKKSFRYCTDCEDDKLIPIKCVLIER